MSRNKTTIVAALCVCAVLTLGTVHTVYAQESIAKITMASAVVAAQQEAEYTKIENVYARLKADGSSDEAYIVNHFQITQPGTVTDYGAYSEIVNLSNADELHKSGDSIAFSTEKGNFYYQGRLNSVKLPWKFNISYQLDGKDVSADSLGGKSGRLKIHFQSEKNEDVDASFGENYLMQISLTLDNDLCSDITAPEATFADAGNNTQLSFTVLPGSRADFEIEADVTDFSMSGFSIAAVPYSMNIDIGDIDAGDITDQFSELIDAAEQLNDGAKELSDGIHELNDGGASLLDGSVKIGDGLSELEKNAGVITDSSKKISDALNTISTQLSTADFSGLSQLSQLPDGLSSLSGALDNISGGLTQLRSGFSEGYNAINSIIASGAQLSMPTQEELEAIGRACASDPAALAGYQKLTAAYKQLQTINAVWAKVQPAFEAVLTTLDDSAENSVISGLNTVSGALGTMSGSMSESLSRVDVESMLGELSDGLSTLASSYAEFHSGLCEYTGGVGTLAENYGEFHSGLSDYTDGVGELDDGAVEYSDGMAEFADGVSGIPDEMQKSIDDMMAEYSSSDFKVTAFTDERNMVSSVQFVISTDGVELPETETEEAPEKEKGFWDRLVALFTGE